MYRSLDLIHSTGKTCLILCVCVCIIYECICIHMCWHVYALHVCACLWRTEVECGTVTDGLPHCLLRPSSHLNLEPADSRQPSKPAYLVGSLFHEFWD